MENNEMHILSKFMFVAKTVNSKVDKKAAMAAKCAASKTKVAFIEKEKTIINTPHGKKKDISFPLPAGYEPSFVEEGWDAWWKSSGLYTPDLEKCKANPDKVSSILIPPPNVTGSLHIGHALGTAIQDLILRWKKMQGHEVCYIPGIDHAGIATQTVVEKNLAKEKGLLRKDMKREEFLEEVWKWKGEFGDKILNQFNRLGACHDMSREFFTMDEPRNKAVTEAFVRMFDVGKIFRDTKLVNWSCAFKTAISDVECDPLELTGATKIQVPGYDKPVEFGVLIDFAYKLKEDPTKEIVVSTTRIETMLGDVAVAVHPKDERYKHLIGKELVHPFFPNRTLVVIADDILVDMTLGTGAVKITPAHDPNDYECGKRHKLPFINILNDDGTLNENAGPYEGLPRYVVRERISKDIEALGLWRGKVPKPMILSQCSKSKDIIEPYIKPQWYCDMSAEAKRGLEDVANGNLKITPEHGVKAWNEFLTKIRDWCISRQLWWGHRCPVYLVTAEGVINNPDTCNNNHWVAARSEEEALKKASIKYSVDPSKISLVQDEDVLDTWFSSALLPLSALGWPEDTPDVKYLFPSTIMETGHDILFFWVARMCFFSYFFADRLPFHEVFLHPIIRDAEGRKMSKSLGNVIDPLEVADGCSIEHLILKIKSGNLPPGEVEKATKEKRKAFPQGIPECGIDALRLSLISLMSSSMKLNMDLSVVVSYRFFCNKMWNATKFLLTKLENDFEYITNVPYEKLSYIDKWMLSKVSSANKAVRIAFTSHRYQDGASAIYSLWKDYLCDIYLESLKPILNSDDQVAKNYSKNILYRTIDNALKLLHPICPFITEELYQRLPHPDFLRKDSIFQTSYPNEESHYDEKIESDVELILTIKRKILSIFAQFNISPSIGPKVALYSQNDSVIALLHEQSVMIKTLGRTGEITLFKDKETAAKECNGWLISIINHEIDAYLDIKDYINVAVEIENLKKNEKIKLDYVEKTKLKIEKGGDKMPDEVKKENNEKLETTQEELKKIQAQIELLSSLI